MYYMYVYTCTFTSVILISVCIVPLFYYAFGLKFLGSAMMLSYGYEQHDVCTILHVHVHVHVFKAVKSHQNLEISTA